MYLINVFKAPVLHKWGKKFELGGCVITTINMESVASYKAQTSLQTDKKINLIYGLNGTGKSTFSNFLYDPSNKVFSNCGKLPENSDPIFVYNQKFIQDNFFDSDSLKGIFSLSKENKQAKEKIQTAEKILADINKELTAKNSDKASTMQSFSSKKELALNEVWKIKTTYTGGDRVFEYCLDKLKLKEKLFEHLIAIDKPAIEPKKNIKTLKKEIEALKGEDAHPQLELPLLDFLAHGVESNEVYGKVIVGNDDSVVSELIESLGNSDWVKLGLEYIPDHIDDQNQECPFCQEKTVTQNLVDSIKDYFDESYQAEIARIETIQAKYKSDYANLKSIETYTEHPFVKEKAADITQKYQVCEKLLNDNLNVMAEKLKRPSSIQKLVSSEQAFAAFNAEIIAINNLIKEYNLKLEKKESTLIELKSEFWSLMRWQYDQTISRFNQDRIETNSKLSDLDKEIEEINKSCTAQNKSIAEAQKETVNVDEAIEAINLGLFELGIDDFKIVKHSDSLYRIVRSGKPDDAFNTLSEGEKMMISFLYFCELCKGRSSAEDTSNKRIAVIDDPISSMSHIFIFNVGQLIRSVFFKSERISQIFVLTHSLYFFYELTDTNKERRKENQKLFRLSKSGTGSKIQEMKYDEIQNDYQAYWSVINDPDQPPALIANCMRNIVEYFFNFVRKKDLNNVFQMPQLQDIKFQAFNRYINRESHSLGQNIIDMKEFNYDTFKDGLRLVFEATGYPDHFKEMSKH